MKSSKPYLIRAIYEWIVDNKMTPYLLVNTEFDNVTVPEDFIEDGTIVLNISPQACRGLHLENDRIVFSGRFADEALQIFVPPDAVLAIYAKENGRGMVFGHEEGGEEGGEEGTVAHQPPLAPPEASKEPVAIEAVTKDKTKPKLKVIK